MEHPEGLVVDEVLSVQVVDDLAVLVNHDTSVQMGLQLQQHVYEEVGEAVQTKNVSVIITGRPLVDPIGVDLVDPQLGEEPRVDEEEVFGDDFGVLVEYAPDHVVRAAQLPLGETFFVEVVGVFLDGAVGLVEGSRACEGDALARRENRRKTGLL